MSAVRACGITKHYDARCALDAVDLTVEPGEVRGLLGSNGAAKTTLLRVLLGLQQRTAGSVTVCGHPSGRGLVGYVPQKIQLDPDMPVRARDLVGLGLDGQRPGIPLPSRRRRTTTPTRGSSRRSWSSTSTPLSART